MSSSFIRVLVLVGLLVPLAVSARVPDKTRIVVYGDSLSAAYGIQVDKGWVSLLQQRLRERNPSWNVDNVSISGETTSGGIARLPRVLKKHRPSIVILQLGGNDGLRGLPLKETEKNLRRMIRQIKQARAQVLLVGVRLPPNYGPHFINGFAALFNTLSREEGVPLVPQLMKGVDNNDALMQADRIHPTEKAQTLLLENVWPGLNALLKNQTQ